MASTTPRTDARPEPADAPVEAARADAEQPRTEEPENPVPMRALLASCRAAKAVSTPPERHAA
ncbi:hypothetical protein [Kitasatospora sp. CB02891]|uniref:hypothetical protein n=1 Tax=Kitasatospora sp. CB02891 TaxID=2020329 RepID=UPI000C2723C4|nr:hypothetical protein [Kitasatospora sp. CB02891]PJN24520.1 hypothetical protein CG736_17850 [Kitasatospora sp. CB02891]